MASVKGVNAWPNADGKQMLSHMSHSLVQQFACKLTTLAVYKKFLSRLLLSIVTEVLSLCCSLYTVYVVAGKHLILCKTTQIHLSI